MKRFIRAMAIPFFIALFPAVWYINRNMTTERLPPYTEPTTGLIALSITTAVLGSAAFAGVMASFRRWSYDGTEHELAYRYRLFQPDRTALVIFLGFITVTLVWALTEMVGVGPSWPGVAMYPLLIPIGIPLLVLAPLAIQFHWAVILGLVLCVLWMSFLGIVLSDIIHQRPLPLVSE